MLDISSEATYKKGKLYSIPLNDVTPDPDQPRKNISESDLDVLKQPIAAHGQLSPILFRVDGDKGLVLVSGERRYRACQALGHATIPGIYIDTNRHDEIALVDNLQRADLHPVDLAEAISSLKVKHSLHPRATG
ncbi:ParB/RepB/Spo0J family partition protein [Geomonas subterranea]|uniref:ParB/RepB/Spo0J family partition protein n=1 Tax=Geomonas subterranea TaxID=2847989 RepID=UPI001CD41F01|nr:ParB/RepB/Spo0J family partition protein [Geomonas fuzhouensis]